MFGILLSRLAQLTNCPQGLTEADRKSANLCNTTLPEVAANPDSLQALLNVVFGAITAVAVLIIIIQGIRFVLSYGEPDKTTQARKGVIYAAVGLVIVFMADIIVAFVLKRFL
jgi:type IV secretory pathway VirB2 component (pilin)